MSDKTETRQAILEAAMERIKHYGYGKTTMSEIAKDCGMSAGNIYRFFASKLDIAEAMARQFNGELYQSYGQIVREQTSAGDRLRKLLNHGMENTYELLQREAKILEVAEVLGNERPLFMNEELAQERIYLCRILEDGVASGEFKPMKDTNFVAEMMQSAVVKFRFPQLYSFLSLPKLQRELTGVLDILIAALRCGVEFTPNPEQ